MLPNDEEHDDLESLLREGDSASEPPGEFVAQLHERLQTAFSESERLQSRPDDTLGRAGTSQNRWRRMSRWMGGFTMRQRIVALSGVSAVVLCGLLFFWGAAGMKPLSAMEKMVESVRRAKSSKITWVIKTTFHNIDSDAFQGKNRVEKSTDYWLAPNMFRTDFFDPRRSQPGQPSQTNILSGEDKPWVSISHWAKSFHRHSRYDKWMKSFAPDMLANLSEEADQDLGTKVVDGRSAWGFMIQWNKINPEVSKPAMLEIWVDRETNLPISLRSELKTERMTAIQESTKIEWNVDLDPSLFDTTPPEGYRDLTWKKPTTDNAVEMIVEAFRPYLGLPYDVCPRMKQRPTVQDVETQLGVLDTILDRLNNERGIFASTDDEDKEKARREERAAQRMREAVPKQREGFLHLWAIVQEDRDVVYNGEAVLAEDKEKILLRWKLDDGQYQVIFGDLHNEVVTAERLDVLEGK